MYVTCWISPDECTPTRSGSFLVKLNGNIVPALFLQKGDTVNLTDENRKDAEIDVPSTGFYLIQKDTSGNEFLSRVAVKEWTNFTKAKEYQEDLKEANKHLGRVKVKDEYTLLHPEVSFRNRLMISPYARILNLEQMEKDMNMVLRSFPVIGNGVYAYKESELKKAFVLVVDVLECVYKLGNEPYMSMIKALDSQKASYGSFLQHEISIALKKKSAYVQNLMISVIFSDMPKEEMLQSLYHGESAQDYMEYLEVVRKTEIVSMIKELFQAAEKGHFYPNEFAVRKMVKAFAAENMECIDIVPSKKQELSLEEEEEYVR